MEQISMFSDIQNPSEQLFKNVKDILTEEGLTEIELSLVYNQGYESIKFSDNAVDIKVKFGKKVQWIAFPISYQSLAEDAEIKQSPGDKNWFRIYIDNPSDIFKYKSIIYEIYHTRLLDTSPDAFDCCSLYMQCSDKKECVQPLKEIHSNCKYKIKIKKGIIFYGKNRTL